MSMNSTETATTSPSPISPFAFLVSRLWVYVIQGFILLGTNSIIFVTIMYHSVLRWNKAYSLVATLAFIDMWDGVAAIVGGVGRNMLIFANTAHLPVSRWACLLTPWNAIWIVIGHVVDLTMLAISLDRLIAICFPLWHFSVTEMYGWYLAACAWTPGLALLGLCMYLSYQHQEPERPAICFTNFGIDDEYYAFHYYYRVVIALAGVGLYVCVVLAYIYRKYKHVQGTEQFKQYEKMQRKLTITLGISCMLSFFFYIVPMFFNAILPHLMPLEMASAIITSTYIIQNMNKMANLFLYSFRHRDLKLGIKYLFSCKELTLEAIKTHAHGTGNIRVVDKSSSRPAQRGNK